MKQIDKWTLGQKIETIQKTVPTFTNEKAMYCTMIELDDLLKKVINYEFAKQDLESMIQVQGY